MRIEMPSSAKNRIFWNSTSAAYQATHGSALEEHPLAWGIWRIPESELGVLGQVEGRRILELGCGAAQWTLALVGRGAQAIGIDLSEQQLAHARTLSQTASRGLRLVQGNAERLPFTSESFDIVFCDHGATVFAPPEHTVAEASRVLKPGGVFAFCMSSPFRDVCFDPVADGVTERLVVEYFSLSVFDDGKSVEYQLPYGAWIRLFRRHALMVEDLIELQAPADVQTTFSAFVPAAWARRWPAEHIWKLKKTPLRNT
jgi:SAM-dependent methyltransferase